MDPRRHRINILGVQVDDVSEKDVIDAVLAMAKNPKKGNFVATVNSEFIMLARKDPEFANILASADLAVPDSWGVVISKLIFGGKVKNRVTGVDLALKLCAKCADLPIAVGFLGGFHTVAKEAAKRQMTTNPGLRVVLAESGNPAMGHDLRLRQLINGAGRVDILFVGYGMGKQEVWIKRNLKHLNVGVAIGVGGALDYLSDTKKRAPVFMQKSGLEWLWRLVNEPTRIGRMRVLPVFLVLVLLRKFRLL